MRHVMTGAMLVTAMMLAAVPSQAQLTVTSDHELAMSGSSSSKQFHPTADVRPTGSLAVWDDNVKGIAGRFFDASGAGVGATIAFAASDPLPPVPFHKSLIEQHTPAVAVKPDGSFVVVWVELLVDHNASIFSDEKFTLSRRILARAFTATGAPKGNVLEVAPRALGDILQAPTIVPTSDGYWIAWHEVGGASDGIHLRRIDKKFRLSKQGYPAKNGRDPALAVGGNGLLLVWDGPTTTGRRQVWGLLYKLSGNANGVPFQVSSSLARDAGAPTVTSRSGNDYLVAWPAVALSTGLSRVFARLVASSGALPGGELVVSPGGGTAPRAAALAGKRFGVAYVALDGPSYVGIDVRTLDAFGNLGTTTRLNELGPLTTDLALSGGTDGRVLAEWVGPDALGRVSIRGRIARVLP
jgi:hypothetical protein